LLKRCGCKFNAFQISPLDTSVVRLPLQSPGWLAGRPAGWTPETTQTWWRRDKSLYPLLLLLVLYLCPLPNPTDSTLKMEVVWSSETLVSYHITMKHHNPEEHDVNFHQAETGHVLPCICQLHLYHSPYVSRWYDSLWYAIHQMVHNLHLV
jgi:hypothetical protein